MGSARSVPIFAGAAFLAAIHGERLSTQSNDLEMLDSNVTWGWWTARNLEAKDEYGRTPIALAAEAGQLEVVKDLAARNANLEAKDRDGWTPMTLAAYKGQWRVVWLLQWL